LYTKKNKQAQRIKQQKKKRFFFYSQKLLSEVGGRIVSGDGEFFRGGAGWGV